MNNHKHKDLITAWAEGEPIQWKDRSGKWIHIINPIWDVKENYRIRPITPNKYYRIYISKNVFGNLSVGIVQSDMCNTTLPKSFVVWMSDWIKGDIHD